MPNTMRAHSAGQISMEGGVDVNKGHMVYTRGWFLGGVARILSGKWRPQTVVAKGVASR